MLEVLCAEDSLLCFDGSSTCAWFTAMLDGDFVLSKARAYKSNRKQQIRLSSTPSYLEAKYDGAEGKNKILDLRLSYLAKYDNLKSYIYFFPSVPSYLGPKYDGVEDNRICCFRFDL